MVARAVWSPSRVKAALQCGRRLQGLEEGWERTEHVRGIRGRAVHAAVDAWERQDRTTDIEQLVCDAWTEIITEDTVVVSPETVMKPVLDLWLLEDEIRRQEDEIAADLVEDSGYKRPRQTKAFEQRTGHLAGAREEALSLRHHEVAEIVDGVDWPWEYDAAKGILVEGLDHSLETVRRGTAYLTELYPDPDIVLAENRTIEGKAVELETALANGYSVRGYIDRVEATSNGVEVVDYKSSKYQDTELDHWLQVATYTVIATDHLGFTPDRVRLAYLRDQDSDVFEVRSSWVESLASLVAAADRALATASFAPTFAGCGICGFKPFCDSEFQLIAVDERTTE